MPWLDTQAPLAGLCAMVLVDVPVPADVPAEKHDLLILHAALLRLVGGLEAVDILVEAPELPLVVEPLFVGGALGTFPCGTLETLAPALEEAPVAADALPPVDVVVPVVDDEVVDDAVFAPFEAPVVEDVVFAPSEALDPVVTFAPVEAVTPPVAEPPVPAPVAGC